MVKNPSFIKLVGQKDLFILIYFIVGHLADQLVLCNVALRRISSLRIVSRFSNSYKYIDIL